MSHLRDADGPITAGKYGMNEVKGVPIPNRLECTGTRPYSMAPKLININSPGPANLSLALKPPYGYLKSDLLPKIAVFSTKDP